jgi:hypothetical protein
MVLLSLIYYKFCCLLGLYTTCYHHAKMANHMVVSIHDMQAYIAHGLHPSKCYIAALFHTYCTRLTNGTHGSDIVLLNFL